MRPMSVPTIPNAGAYMPALFRALTRSDGPATDSAACVRSAASAWSTGAPSTAISRADRSTGSSTSPSLPSSASGPSRLAVRAKSVSWAASAA